ncbi:MAG TPA: response regulator [Myxococcales bacterium]|jgi:DNA-binding response OmpR family regulator
MTRILLLVDDEPRITDLLRLVLKRSFDEVHTATSGEAASEILDEHPVTHVVADYVLGADEPNGATLLAAWRRIHPSIRFAAILTGRCSIEDLVGRPGIDAAFEKPAADEVIQRLRDEP